VLLQEASKHDSDSDNVAQQQLQQQQQRRPRSSRGFLSPTDDAVMGSAFVAQGNQMCSKLEALVDEGEETM